MKTPFETIMQYLAVVVDSLYLVVLVAIIMKLFELWS